MKRKPTFISLFAGCGGSSLGYRWAGYKELLAIEWDDNAAETFKLNFPDIPIWKKDVRKVTGNEILDFCNIKKGELDLLDASPPCQGFSTAGKRQVTDPRNDLFKEFIRLIKELEPKVFVMENVSGLIKGKMKGRFIEIMKELKGLPYQVKCKLMNAMYYNVPQSRARLIWIATRKDISKEPSYPVLNEKFITVKVAFQKVINEKWELDWVNHIRQSTIYPRICKMKPGECYDKYSPNGSGFTLRRIKFNEPSSTISRTVNHSASSDGLLHPKENRKLTISEIKALHSYPSEFKTQGDFRGQWAVIGNSVPPKFMKAIATTIRQQVFDQ